MRHYIIVLIIMTGMLLSSCSKTYYQMYDVASPSLNKENEKYVYEDSTLKLTYNFWENQGGFKFTIHNKTNDYIYFDKTLSHFISNGISYDYFKNRTYTSTQGKVTGKQSSFTFELENYTNTDNNENFITTGEQKSSINSESVTYREKEIIKLPPKSMKIIEEFYISDIILRNCNLLIYPSTLKHDGSSSVTYTEQNTPINFKNFLTFYLKNPKGESLQVINKFWVNKITNLKENKFYNERKKKFCGEESIEEVKIPEYKKPTRFYIEYEKESEHPFDH